MDMAKDIDFRQEDARTLQPLVNKILELSAHPRQEERKKLWAGHHALYATERIPVTVYYEGIPRSQWKFMFGKNYLKTKSALAQRIEFDLKRQLWMAENVPDDHIIWPSVILPAAILQPVRWGVPLKWVGTDENANNPLEARKIIPPFVDQIDVGRLRFTDMVIDKTATSLRVEQANELVESRLHVDVYYSNLGYSPFEVAVKMRGIQNIMYDVIDHPDRVHSLMDFITSAYESHHRGREERGWINCALSADGKYTQVGFRVHCAFRALDFNLEMPRLADEWAYISAQSSAGFSPELYEEFVHSYNVRLAKNFVNQTVYYHGCECLDRKLNVIAKLPNLRRFHVSPWSSLEVAKEIFQGELILEVHAHPGTVFFSFTREDMRSNLKELVRAAEGVPIDLNLSDIHSFNGDPELLTMWAEEAQRVAQEKK